MYENVAMYVQYMYVNLRWFERTNKQVHARRTKYGSGGSADLDHCSIIFPPIR